MLNKALLRFCGKSLRYVVLAVLANCARLLMGIAFAYLFAYFLSLVAEGGEIPWALLPPIVAALVFKQLFIRTTAKNNFRLVREVKHNLRRAIYAKALGFGSAYRERAGTQELIQLAVEGVEQLETYYGAYLTQFCYAFASSLLLFAALYPLYPTAAWLLLLAAPVIPLSLQAIMRVVRATQRRYWKRYTDVGNLFLDSLSGLTTLKIFAAEQASAARMDARAEAFRRQTMRVLAMQLNSIMLIDWIAYGTSAAVVVLALVNYAQAGLSLFAFLALLLLSAEFFVPMRSLTSLFHVAMTGVSAGERILSFLDAELPEEKGEARFPAGADIELRDYSYRYPDGTEALKNISLRFEGGAFTALAGPSGCGKSTLAALLCGELRGQEEILYGGLAGGALGPGELSRHVLRVGHEPHIFAATVRENLTMGKEGVADAELIALLKRLRLWDFLAAKQGLDTPLLSEGKDISGGQRQRLAIARAVVADFQIYIFDEASSNVDVESEEIILRMIRELAGRKTVIFISHKMRSLQDADYCYVMDGARVVERGTHAALVQAGGLYQRLYEEQEALLSFGQGQDAQSGRAPEAGAPGNGTEKAAAQPAAGRAAVRS